MLPSTVRDVVFLQWHVRLSRKTLKSTTSELPSKSPNSVECTSCKHKTRQLHGQLHAGRHLKLEANRQVCSVQHHSRHETLLN